METFTVYTYQREKDKISIIINTDKKKRERGSIKHNTYRDNNVQSEQIIWLYSETVTYVYANNEYGN